MDLTPDIQPKSDQLNADSLIGGPITVCVEGVGKGNSDQPVVIRISGGHCPFKPGKTALRVLAAAWGTDASAWVGRWMTLYRDPTVTWAGSEVGGIRVKALSHIERPMNIALPVSRGKKSQHRIAVLKPGQQAQQGAPTADLDALLAESGLEHADVDRWLAAADKPPLAEVAAEDRAKLAAMLAANPHRIDEIRALIPGGEE